MADHVSEFVKNKGPIAVALDADQVLANAFPLILDRINSMTGSSYGRNDMTEYPCPGTKLLGITTDEFDRLYDDIWGHHWREIRALPEARLLYRLCDAFKVDVVSSRGKEELKPLKDWLKANYPKAKLRVLAVPKYSDKTSLPYSVYIDDAPRIAEVIRGQGNKLLMLIDAPYNRRIPDSANVVRFRDADAAFEKLLSLRQQE
jgi:5'(3')-deoxyribonucleotidase